MDPFIFQIVILLIAAFAGGSVARRFGYPAAIGELSVGVIIGPFALGFIEFSDTLLTFAEFGTIILLFYIGLDTDVGMLRRYLLPSLLSGVVGALLPLVMGYYGALLLGLGEGESLFVGTVLTATSIGITVAMMSDLDRLKTKEGMTILGAGVVDDVVAIILVSVVVSILAGEFAAPVTILASVITKAAVFWAVTLFLGTYVLTRILDRLRTRTESLMLIVLALGFLGSFGAIQLGLSSAIGAFAVGLALSSMTRAPEVRENMQQIYLFFVPIFFISIGMLMDPRAFLSSIVPGLVITALAVLSKVIGCGGSLLLAKYSRDEALTVGIGMIPRGEVGLIIASVGLASGFIAPETYLISVMAVTLTTIMALPFLKMFLGRQAHETVDEAPAIPS